MTKLAPSHPNPIEKLLHWEANAPTKTYFRQPTAHGKWRTLTWGEVAREVRSIASVLAAMHLPRGSSVAILSKNCAHWIMADYAIWMSGHVSVPIFPNLSAPDIQKIIAHSDVKLIFLGKVDHGQKVRRELGNGIPILAFPYEDFPDTQRWDDLIPRTAPLRDVVERGANEIATIIYTSGTTGAQKGVVHTFGSLSFAGAETARAAQIRSTDKFFSYLPLAHVAERLIVELVSLYSCTEIGFPESLETFTSDMQKIEPTVFLGVPRIWSKFQSGILAKLPTKKLNLLLKIPIVSFLIKRKIRRGLGLGNARLLITGAAPIAFELLDWFQRLGMTITEGYGMTENFCYAAYNQPGRVRLGTVGPAWPHVEIKIGADREVLVASPALMAGYFKEETAEQLLVEGKYFPSGDTGELDADGALRITGRVKDLFKTAKAKYVSPSKIELLILANALVENACVLGSGLSQPIALVLLVSKNRTGAVEAELRKLKEVVNEGLYPHERISHLVILPDTWSVENGVLTPTLKIKRRVLEEKYSAHLSEWVASASEMLWV